MNRSGHLVLASRGFVICLGPKAFSQPASPGSIEKATGAIDNRPIKLTLDTASYMTLIGGR